MRLFCPFPVLVLVLALRVFSEKKRRKVFKNPKFSEHELEVAVAQKLGPKAIIYHIYCCISADKLMLQIHETHLARDIPAERFAKGVNIVDRSIRSGLEAISNTVLEGNPAVIGRLTSAELTYTRQAV